MNGTLLDMLGLSPKSPQGGGQPVNSLNNTGSLLAFIQQMNSPRSPYEGAPTAPPMSGTAQPVIQQPMMPAEPPVPPTAPPIPGQGKQGSAFTDILKFLGV